MKTKTPKTAAPAELGTSSAAVQTPATPDPVPPGAQTFAQHCAGPVAPDERPNGAGQQDRNSFNIASDLFDVLAMARATAARVVELAEEGDIASDAGEEVRRLCCMTADHVERLANELCELPDAQNRPQHRAGPVAPGGLLPEQSAAVRLELQDARNALSYLLNRGVAVRAGVLALIPERPSAFALRKGDDHDDPAVIERNRLSHSLVHARVLIDDELHDVFEELDQWPGEHIRQAIELLEGGAA